MPSKDKTAAQSLELMEKEIERIKKEPVTPQELAKYKQMSKKALIGQLKSNGRLAAQLTDYDVVQGDWRLLFDELAKHRQDHRRRSPARGQHLPGNDQPHHRRDRPREEVRGGCNMNKK